MTTPVSPLFLLYMCWVLTGAVTAWTLVRLPDLFLVQLFMYREGITVDVFGAAGLIWATIGLLSFTVGDLAARMARCKPTRQVHRPTRLDLERAARMTFFTNVVLLAVTGLWIMTAASKVGGLSQLATTAYADSLSARDLLLDSKLFTGMRLFYAALPATACLAAGLLATGKLRRRSRRLMHITLVVNIAALLILPIVMSQRLLLLQLLLSAYIAACVVRRRVFGLHWIAIGVALFLSLWIAREAITNPVIEGSALNIAAQKLAYYVVNDMFNAFAPLTQPIPHTYGGLTLEGVMFLTFSDDFFLTLLTPRLEALDAVQGGGEFPFLTAAFIDYGPFGGALFIGAIGFVMRRIFERARHSLGWTVVYAQIGATLLFSNHSVYFTHQNFYFSAILIGVVIALSRTRAVQSHQIRHHVVPPAQRPTHAPA